MPSTRGDWAPLAGVPFLPAAEALFDRVADLVFFVKDEGARYVAVNKTLVERCGVATREYLLGKTALDVFPSPLGDAYHEQDMRVLRTGLALTDVLELHLYVRGEPGWCTTNKVPLAGEGGAVVGLIGVSKDLHVPAADRSGYRELAESVRYIQTRYGDPLRVDDLARMSSLSVYQYEQRMKKIFQLTAGQFIAKTRIDAACGMLRDTDAPIAEIATDCGFYDQSAFTRQFKAATGLTPTAYRAQTRGVSG